MQWSIITVTYNSSAALRSFWSQSTASDIERIVVDNASTDGSASLARALGADQVIEAGKNLGFSGGNNLGAKVASGTYLAFVNPDVNVRHEDLERIEDYLKEHDEIVSPQLIYPDGSPQPNGRGLPYLFYKVLSLLLKSDAISRYHLYATSKNRPVIWVIGAVVCIRRETFMKIGAWDEKFFVYYEDSDLGIRALEAGVKTTVLNSVRWVHGWARETRGVSRDAWRLEARSAARFYRRYPLLIAPNRWAKRYERLASL